MNSPRQHTVLIHRLAPTPVVCACCHVAAGLILIGFSAFAQSNTTAAPALDAADYQRLVDENLGLRREQSRLTRDANDLRRRNASLVLQVQELERKQEALSSALADLKAPDELKAELARVRKERDALNRDLERLRSETPAAAGRAPAPAAPAPGAGSDLYRKLERDNAELRSQLATALAASQNETKAHAAAGLRETQLAAQVEEVTRELALQRREGEQAAAREKMLRTALIKVARKAQAYETTLREAEARRLAQSAATNVVIVGAASRGPGPAPVRKPEPALLDAARKAMAAGQYRDAERIYLAGLQRDPKNAQLHYNLGVLYDDYLQDPREAAAHYRRYLALNPAAPDAAIVRSWLVELDVRSR